MLNRLELNPAGIRELLKSPGVVSMLRDKADKVVGRAGPGHASTVSIGATRARASVVTVTAQAQLAEARDRNLTRALDAAR